MPPSDILGRKVFKVFNQEFVVDERYNVTKELGQGAYGIVWYACPTRSIGGKLTAPTAPRLTFIPTKASPSRRSPMFLVRRFWPSAR